MLIGYNQKMQRVFSGVKPSGELHIGNYLGAIKQFVELQNKYEVFLCVVDEHAITVPQEPEKLRERTIEVARTYLAAGMDPAKSVIFVQSHVPAHAELGWILNTMTPLGELERMTQFKEKKQKQISVYAGLFNYPTLMAADILLYQTDIVPVGDDQLQHIELTRSLAERFNNRFGKTFTLPQARVKKETARILALDSPRNKMSKSDKNEKGYILLSDPPEKIRDKIKSAVTDSGKEIIYDPVEKPALSNLLVLYSEFSGKKLSEIIAQYVGRSYAEFKNELADVVIGGLLPIQQKLLQLKADENAVLNILREGAQKAAVVAEKTMADVKQKMGFLV